MGQLNLNNFKVQIKSILDTANTTTASVDLSNGMTERVKKILKVNIGLVPLQPSFIPAVSMWYSNKDVTNATIARTQSSGKRRANVDINIAGIMWQNQFDSVTSDVADEDIEKLMENVEEILRDNFTLNGTVNTSFPLAVSYHTFPGEQTHYRIGMMAYQMDVFY